MEFSELVRTRRTVHNYLATPIPRPIVDQALELSLWSPNHKLTYPWVYTWLGPQARAAMAALSVELKSAKGALSEIKVKAINDSMLNPAHLIAVGIRRSDPFTEHEDYATLAGSLQIAAMDLWANGIGTKWSTGGAWLHARAYEVLGLDAGAVRLEGALMIGVPQTVPHAPMRPPLSQFLREVP